MLPCLDGVKCEAFYRPCLWCFCRKLYLCWREEQCSSAFYWNTMIWAERAGCPFHTSVRTGFQPKDETDRLVTVLEDVYLLSIPHHPIKHCTQIRMVALEQWCCWSKRQAAKRDGDSVFINIWQESPPVSTSLFLTDILQLIFWGGLEIP